MELSRPADVDTASVSRSKGRPAATKGVSHDVPRGLLPLFVRTMAGRLRGTAATVEILTCSRLYQRFFRFCGRNERDGMLRFRFFSGEFAFLQSSPRLRQNRIGPRRMFYRGYHDDQTPMSAVRSAD